MDAGLALVASLALATAAHGQNPSLGQQPPTSKPGLPKLSALLVDDAGRPITNSSGWAAQRRALQTQWLDYLGRPLGTKPPLQAEVLATEELPEFTRRHVKYKVEDGLFTDAYLLTPKQASGKLPAVVVFHPTVSTHAQQVAGVGASDPQLTHGVQLAQRGYVVLCPRCFIFGEGADYAGHVRAVQARHTNWTGLARMTWDAMRAVDYLESLPNVQTNRIGCLGHSLGAKEVLYAAAFDERYRAAVFSEGGLGLEFSNWDAVWYLGPGIKRPGFNLEHHQLLALIAPRPFLLLAGESADGDKSWPFLEAARPVYQLLDVPRNLDWLNHREGHRYSPAARVAAEQFLDAHLKSAPKQWTLAGPLGETPSRSSDTLPLSDQKNTSGWVKRDDLWDEFDGSALDTNKWTVGMSWWQGRQPAWFNPTNVTVRDGQLHLTMRREKVPERFEKLGYTNYTSAALHTRARAGYGYYEVKARPMDSGGSSSFWFQQEDPKAHPNWATEIDVFELCGKSSQHDRRYYMTLHVTKTPLEKRHWSAGQHWTAPWRFAEAFHVFGFEWGREELRWYVDGVLVRTVLNTHWHQPLFLIFDSETMPEWFGMPKDADLPSTFSVEYVRAWKGAGEP